MNKKQKGFLHIGLLIPIAVIILVIAVGGFVFSAHNKPKSSVVTIKTQDNKTSPSQSPNSQIAPTTPPSATSPSTTNSSTTTKPTTSTPSVSTATPQAYYF